VKAVCGKRAKMEDAFSVQTNFFIVDMAMSPVEDVGNKLPARIATQVRGAVVGFLLHRSRAYETGCVARASSSFPHTT
jgi:hypothetical protein